MLISLLGYIILAISLLAILTGLAIVFKWAKASEDQLHLLLGGLLALIILLMTLPFILEH